MPLRSSVKPDDARTAHRARPRRERAQTRRCSACAIAVTSPRTRTIRRPRSTTPCERRREFDESPIPKPDVEAQILADIAAAHYLAGRNGDAERFYAEALAEDDRDRSRREPECFLPAQ